ncbi:MAG: Zinc transporter, periplasmic-binding protein ZnuA [Firmicutes bacterium]|nr:Zinc transporter, periplasmic-binding protein ZnuA [Bacillota bacterium]
MFKRLLPLLMILGLLLTACGPGAGSDPKQPEESASLSLVASTYPLYLFATEVTKGAEGVTVSLLVNQDVSCLHDYTLTVADMKLLETADVLILNGAGLDDFVAGTLEGLPQEHRAAVIDCSQSVQLLSLAEEHDHEDGEDHAHGDWDPHYWMDPTLAGDVLLGIAGLLGEMDPEYDALYHENAEAAVATLTQAKQAMQTELEPLTARELITFHDGFQYFARAFDFTILMSIEEEEGREASAKVISEAANLVTGYGLPAIFTEVNSSDATAQAVARETGTAVYPLTMIMSGPSDSLSIQTYIDAMNQNVDTILGAFQ